MRMMTALLLLVMLATPLPTSAQTTKPATMNAWTATADGEFILRAFPHAPYPHASRTEGHTYQNKFYSAAEHYSDSTVGIFIPKGYRDEPGLTFLVHFHGWNNHVASVLEHYNLPHQLEESGVNAILVVPQGPKDAPDSGDGKLENDEGALKALLEEVAEFLASEHKVSSTKIEHVVITAHSGGYKVASFVLEHGGMDRAITECFLFDASYGNLDRFAHWAAASPKHRLVSFYTQHLAGENKELMGLMEAGKVSVKQISDSEFGNVAVATRGAVFVSTDLAHDEVPAKRGHLTVLMETVGWR